MARVEIDINGRPYTLACEDGQEARLREVAVYLDARLRQVTGGRGGSDAQILVVTALVLADELLDLKAASGGSSSGVDEAGLAAAVDAVARRIEEVAARIERA